MCEGDDVGSLYFDPQDFALQRKMERDTVGKSYLFAYFEARPIDGLDEETFPGFELVNQDVCFCGNTMGPFTCEFCRRY